MIITKAEQPDAINIHRLIADVLGSYNLYHLRPDFVDNDIDDLSKHYFENGGYFWIMRNEAGDLIASVAIYKINNTTCELRKMYLLPQEQGKGLGKILLKTAVLKAKELGYAKMILKTNSKLDTAIALYKKFGFDFYTLSNEDKKADCDVAMQWVL